MASGKTPKLSRWLAAIRAILKKDKKSIADFASEIGRGDNYHQVYCWLAEAKSESHQPKGEMTIIFIEWALKRDPSLIRLLGIKCGIYGGPVTSRSAAKQFSR